MNSGPMEKTRARLARAAMLIAVLLAPLPAGAGSDASSEITAVSSVVSSGYVRTKLSDGSFKPELYAFGSGGRIEGRLAGDSIDKMTFADIARVVSAPLAGRRYMPATDPGKVDLLIMVYWGTTSGAEGASSSAEYQNLQANQVQPTPPPMMVESDTSMGASQAAVLNQNRMSTIQGQMADSGFDSALAAANLEDRIRLKADARNAMLLGYDSELEDSAGLEGTALGGKRSELIREIEESRYFVVLMAYDFQRLLKDKKPKLLWVTRISIRQHDNEFQKVLPAMTWFASEYFGQDTHGLLRRQLPEGHVDVGEPKPLGVVPDK